MAIYYKCPKCGDPHHIRISASIWVSLEQDPDPDTDNLETDADGGHEWDDESLALCTSCGWCGSVWDMQKH